ncbi:aromatase/cyclase [Streptomyces sp. IBSBF 2435]|uniref:aromatase/cyclase n=1 Tax=Streptomyces sp. IBSBF 2435 TaxID=2903531 RepID=UPI002FDBE3C5
MATVHHTQHTVTVAAPADTAYDLIADAANWPRVFPPSVHVEQTPLGGGEETVRIWATANDEVKNWTSRRRLDPAARTVTFRQQVSQPPVASMGGTWTIRPLSAASCEVVLDHDFTAVGDTPQNVAWIGQAVDRNSGAELERLRATAEQIALMPELSLTFDDEVTIQGSAADVHDFIWQAEAWEERLPHVKRVVLTEPGEGMQTLEMDTLAKDGSQHTTKSVRVSFRPGRIVYKQLLVPALLTVHTGEWILRDTPAGLSATSRHTIVVDPDAVTRVLGAEATVADARDFVRTALGTNSLATLGHAKRYAEERAGLSKVG